MVSKSALYPIVTCNTKYMKKTFLLFCLLFVMLFCKGQNNTFSTETFEMEINQAGCVTALIDKSMNKDYMPVGQKSPLLTVRVGGAYESPTFMAMNETTQKITLVYPQSKTTVVVQVKKKEGYLTFEIVSLKSAKKVELVVWGPYATSITQTIGECVGVVRNSSFALGIQALNIKTLGGYPSTEDDIDPSFDIFATNSLVDVSDSVKVLYRGQTAKLTDFGSVLQAYCRNRSEERVISMWGHDKYVAPVYLDGGIIGSKIALFGCPEKETLNYLEKIELGEHLPHPRLNGEWVKRTPEASQAYIIYPFNETNIEEAIAFTKRTGLKYLYHAGPFETWGNFKLLPSEFPSGMDGLKACVEKARKEGINIGVHTLSNFITTNDAYVTPVPDKRLAKVGSSALILDVNATQTEINIKDPDFFNQMANNSLHGVMVGDELIRYESVSQTAPWTLLNCERGAWGTKAASHAKGDIISKLMDHGYKTFLTDIDLTKEIGRNIATVFNKTGIRQVSFDGLEGAWSTGLGQYGLSLLIKEWYDHLLPELRGNINDASMTTHYNWHTFTRMNWGEPWYAGFRESQMTYRLMNQDFYRRNLIPCMLGWFKFDANTSIEDMEWLLARSAAFDAGYTLVTNKENIEKNGNSTRIVQAIREWENARLSGAFPDELKKKMEHIANEYSLTEQSSTSWSLSPFCVQRYKHINIVRQPGEPVVSKWEFDNPYTRQPLQFILKANDRISEISLEIANYSTVSLNCVMEEGQYLKYTGEEYAVIYDKNWNEVKRVPLNSSKMNMPKGKSSLIFSCKFSQADDSGKFLSGEFKTVGEIIPLTATRKRNN